MCSLVAVVVVVVRVVGGNADRVWLFLVIIGCDGLCSIADRNANTA